MRNPNVLLHTTAHLEKLDEQVELEFATLKSYQNFEAYFTGDVRQIRAVTYAESAEMILDVFDQTDADQLDVLVGDSTSDYRENLRGNHTEAARLARLQREERLRIFLTGTRQSEVHTKFYILTHADGSRTTIMSSANLSKQGWTSTYQTNFAVVVWTDGDQQFDAYMDEWYAEFQSYGEQFMGDLLIDIEDTPESEIENRVYAFVDGRTTTQSEQAELQQALTKQLSDTPVEKVGLIADWEDEQEVDLTVGLDNPREADTRIRPSLAGFDNSTDSLREDMRGFDDVQLSNQRLEMPAGSVTRYTREKFGVPKVWTNETGQLILQRPNGKQQVLTRPWPDDTGDVDRALGRVQEYIDTVDEHGDSQQVEAVKAQMWEVILWYFWAPFAEDYAREYNRRGIDLDKYIDDLYLLGETNSGKGSLAQYANSLISDSVVTALQDGDELGKRRLRSLRQVDSRYPVTFDDVSSRDVNYKTYLNFRQKHWQPDGPVIPAMAFISNDDLPRERIQSRLKTLHLPVQFPRSHTMDEQLTRYNQRTNPLYAWFAHEFARRDIAVPEGSDDTLTEARQVMVKLFEYADRDLPECFPRKLPAEEEYDTGKYMWQTAYKSGIVTFDWHGENITATFDENMSKYSARTYDRALGESIRSVQRGNTVVIKTPVHAQRWFPFSIQTGLSTSLRSLF